MEKEPLIYATDQPPNLSGPAGFAWVVDSEAIWRRYDREGSPAELMAGNWIIRAPMAHPFWDFYSLACYSLRQHPLIKEETIFHLPGATHELLLHAMDPNKQATLNDRQAWLTPTNFAAQIIAESDQAASERIQAAVLEVVNGTLNPDTDFMHQWIERFGDNMVKPGFRVRRATMVQVGSTLIADTGAAAARAIVPPPEGLH